ncbi:hypothetical protein QTP88_005327 [Uroleucon formosanum]
MSTASNMCMLYCALIVCTLVSTVITTNTNTVGSNGRKFDSKEVTTEENFTDRRKMLITTTTTIAKGKYALTTTQSTLSGTDLNNTMFGDEANLNLSEEVIDDSQEPENNKNSSEEPISTNDQAQKTLTRMASTPRTKTADDQNVSEMSSTEYDIFEKWFLAAFPSTTFIGIQKGESTTTSNTPSVTDLNVKRPLDVIGNSTIQPKPKNGYNLSHEIYNTTKSIPANDGKRSKPMRRKTKWFDSSTPFIFFNSERSTIRYYRPTEWIKPTNKNCKCGKQHLEECYDKEKETTTTTIFGQLSKKKRYGQERHMSETTMSDVEEQLEKSKKWKLQQKILEMESDRLKTILDILNSQ